MPEARDTFRELVDTHGGMLWRIVVSYELDPELRRDLYQEVLVAVWRAMPKFAGDASIKTYLARIAQNRCITHVSREVSRPGRDPLSDDLVSAQPEPDATAEAHSDVGRLRRAVARLPLPLRQVTTLALEDMSPKDIAEVLGTNANAVSIKLTRAKKALRETLEELP